MDWLLLFIGMTVEGGWSIHQAAFETEELCNKAKSIVAAEIKEDGDRFLRMACVQNQTDYGLLRKRPGK